MLKSFLNPMLRVFLFLLLINASWIFAAWFWLERSQWLWVTPIALSINFLFLAYDQVLTFSHLESQKLLGQDPWRLLKIVNELSAKFDVRTPEVYLLQHPSAHIFAYAKSRRKPRLYVTEGLLKLLTHDELIAVLTYQMVAIQSSIAFLNYWLGAAIDIFLRVGQLLERLIAFIFGYTPPIKSVFVTPFIWIFQGLLISPWDYRRLDKATAEKVTSPEVLARALWKMEAYAQTKPWRDPWVFSHMCMVSPLAAKRAFRILRPQPALKSRVKRLVGRYPL